jgi:hypothetical protein
VRTKGLVALSQAEDREFVVVPRAAGPLVRPAEPGQDDAGRERDDLDELIDELFPDSEGGPGLFDLTAVAAGLGLVTWSVLAGGPPWALAVGLAVLALGLILPVRSAWRWAGSSRTTRRRQALLARGVPLRTDDAVTGRLVRAHDSLLALGAGDAAADPARIVAHQALLEVATLLDGRTPASVAEEEYVTTRAAAIEELAAALQVGGGHADGPDPRLVAEARAELDALSDGGALARLEDLTREARDERPSA